MLSYQRFRMNLAICVILADNARRNRNSLHLPGVEKGTPAMPETIRPSDAPHNHTHADGRLERYAPQPAAPQWGPSQPGASRGQTLFEYALIILFVVLAVVLSLALIAPALNHIFNQVPNAF
jgi:Flp pilus assembly pilin Flp